MLLIEGGESLAEDQARSGPAAAYGVNGKIDQVMFTGHGNARAEMAATIQQIS